jgi:hypothetical protein
MPWESANMTIRLHIPQELAAPRLPFDDHQGTIGHLQKRSGFGGELIHCAGKIRGGDQWRGSLAFSMSTIGSPTYRRKATILSG